MKNSMKFTNKVVLVLLVTFTFIYACKKASNNEVVLQSYLSLQLPAQNYDYTLNPDLNKKHRLEWISSGLEISNEKATLGRVLFYDKLLSLNNAIACASCHKQEMGFADGQKFSSGFSNQLTKRNSMAIVNPLFEQSTNRSFFWDLRESDLNMMVIKPVQNHIEMGFDTIANVITKMKAVGYYNKLFTSAYGNNEITVDKIRESLAQFLLSMVTVKSPYDQAVENNFGTFTPQQLRGWKIFSDEANCISCHGGDLTNGWSETAANIGLDINYTDKGSVGFNGKFPIFFDKVGMPIIATNPQDQGEGYFKVPSLRNIELTGPYMHDGRFNTLEQVVEHYNSGIKNHPNLHWNLRTFNADGTSQPKRLNLNQSDKEALVSFLKTLTDRNFINDKRFSNPFVAKPIQ